MSENDAFEQTLSELFKADTPEDKKNSENKKLKKVLKRANRQVGASALFSLLGRTLEASVIALHASSAHLKPVGSHKDIDNDTKVEKNNES